MSSSPTATGSVATPKADTGATATADEKRRHRRILQALTGLLLGGTGILTVGGVLLSSLLFPAAVPAASTPAPAATQSTSVESPATDGLEVPEVPEVVPAPVVTTPRPTVRTGRWNDDPTIDSIDLVNDPDAAGPLAPTRPGTAPGTTPGPGDGSGSTRGPGVSTPTASSGYLAPIVAGTASPGSSVAMDIDGDRYTPTVAPDGSWSFDPRALTLPAGTHDYQVWAFDDQGQSAATTGSFTILPIVITGFENIAGTEDMLVEEASTTGLVIAATGPANGTIFVDTMQGHSAMIPLDENGYALKRLRMNSRGWYWFNFRALDSDGFWGPSQEHALDVYDPDIIFDPWGPGPEEMTFEITDP